MTGEGRESVWEGVHEGKEYGDEFWTGFFFS